MQIEAGLAAPNADLLADLLAENRRLRAMLAPLIAEICDLRAQLRRPRSPARQPGQP